MNKYNYYNNILVILNLFIKNCQLLKLYMLQLFELCKHFSTWVRPSVALAGPVSWLESMYTVMVLSTTLWRETAAAPPGNKPRRSRPFLPTSRNKDIPPSLQENTSIRWNIAPNLSCAYIQGQNHSNICHHTGGSWEKKNKWLLNALNYNYH